MRGRVAVVGIGHSDVYRRAEVPLGMLAIDACRKAVADAGLTLDDIDGITTSPVQPFAGAGTVDGINFVSTGFAIRALGINPSWSDEGGVMVTQTFIQAVNAIAAGVSKYVLIFRSMHNPDGRYGRTDPTTVGGAAQFTFPYGATGPTGFAALQRRYMEKYGATREQLGAFVVRARETGLKWPDGYWYQRRPEPLTLDDYMNARPISEPMSIYDCDLPVQGAAAFVMTTADRAADLPGPAAYIRGTAVSPTFFDASSDWHTLEQYLEIGKTMAKHLYATAGVGPGDVDVANLYDGFSLIAPLWAEAFELCGEGEAFSWIADPTIPLNTSSGNLGAGRMHGSPHLMDGAMQVMGRSGERQVEGAEISLVAIAPTRIGGGVVFSRDPS